MATTRGTANEQLDRLLYILPLAAREGGCELEELAAKLGTSVSQVVRDLQEVTARAYYHPAGGSDNLQILIDGDRVRIWTTGEFKRPLRLSPFEGLALALGFRVLAADEAEARRPALLAAASSLEGRAARGPVETLLESIAIDAGERGGADIQTTLRRAARERRQARIEYLKPNADRAESRIIHPYTLVRTESGWYALAHSVERDATRAFRLDRMLSASLLPDTFEIADGFDAEAWLADGVRPFRAAREVEVVVRYSARIARWIREKGVVEEADDGGVTVRHRVADLDWAVRHVLQYGPDAEILDPPEARDAVLAVLEGALRS